MSKPVQQSPTDIVFSPAQISRTGTAYLEERVASKGAGIPFGLPSIDSFFNPALPGDLITVIARPGHGKTAVMMRWARWRAEQLRQQQMPNRAVVYVTYEQHIEDLHAFHVASEAHIDVGKMARGELTDEDVEMIRYQGARRVGLPLWFMGHSQERRAKRPRMTLDILYAALESVEQWQEEGKRGITIDMVFVDYLQRMPLPPHSESKTIGLDANLNSLKDFGLHFACPIIVGVQARREVDTYQIPLPSMGDGQWTSAIEQVSDKIFTVVRPCLYRNQGDQFGSIVVQGHQQMYVNLAKQKLGKANVGKWVMFAPEYNQLEEAEIKNYDLNRDQND